MAASALPIDVEICNDLLCAFHHDLSCR